MRLIKIILFNIFATVFLFLAIDYILTQNMVHPKKEKLQDKIFQGKVLRIPSDVFNHGFSPNHYGMQTWSNYLYEICTDENAFKISCKNRLVASGKKFDIAFIGDSFTEGIGMTYENTFVGMYADNHRDLKIANLGVSSYSPIIYFTKIKSLLDSGFEFKKVVVFIDVSDIQDEAMFKTENGRVTYDKVNFSQSEADIKQSETEKRNLIPSEPIPKFLDKFRYSGMLFRYAKYGKLHASQTIPSSLIRGEWTYNNNSVGY